MSATTRRRRNVAAPLEVVHLTQHWRLIKGRWYRDAVVVVDGEQWVYALKDAA
jgi:hypothetical protein